LVSIFIAPDFNQIKASKKIGATHVEIHTGYYANAVSATSCSEELDKVRAAAYAANKLGLRVNAGHGLNYQNAGAVAKLEFIEELNIGHAIVSRSSLVGIETAIRDMVALIS
jgi:pyridoxine 5-phosphate synthase